MIVMKVPSSYRVTASCYNRSVFQLHGRKFIFFFVFSSLCALSSFAQESTVTGRVSRGDSALAYVTVTVKNSSTGTKTDESGVYRITTRPDATLVFTSVGFEPQEVRIEGRSVVNVELKLTDQQLEDVIVVGYGTQRRGNITGAVANIRSSDLMRTPASTTTSALVGRVAGITARQTTGRPGQGTTFQIRNLGDPLYVIDGVPQSEGQFNNISSEDIESISILKDAAAALYGFRASNGVVLVTTKKGKGGIKGNLSVNTYYQLQNYTRYLSAADAYTHMRASAEAQQNA